jgi:carbonic anhydrase
MGEHSGEFITNWMATAEAAKAEALAQSKGKSKKERLRNCEFAVLKQSYRNLYTFPWLKKGVDSKRLAVLAWYFDLEEGQLLEYSPGSDSFSPIT